MKKKLFTQAKHRKMNVPRMLESLHCIYCEIKSDPMMNEIAEHVHHAEELLREMRTVAVAVAREAGEDKPKPQEENTPENSRYSLDDQDIHIFNQSRFRYH
jgi:hypothetical protein